MTDQRNLFETAVVDRLKESGFLEVEIRVECLARCDDGYQDEVINAGWHYWNAAIAANPAPQPNVPVAFSATAAYVAEFGVPGWAASPLTDLRKFVDLIEGRAMACDGPVTPFLDELAAASEPEKERFVAILRQLYSLGEPAR
jgi:hypothetical protein